MNLTKANKITFSTVMMTPSTMSSQGWKGYLIFTIFNFTFIPFIYFFYPETSGRRLEEIEAIFYKTNAIVKGTKWAKRGNFESDGLESALDNALNVDMKVDVKQMENIG
jgi:hypothetical protein